jgi:Predicted transcriptional regulator
MILLKKSGLVRAERGCIGGYSLNHHPEEISVLDVITLFEGSTDLVRCSKGRERCMQYAPCLSRPVWERISSVLRDVTSRITLASTLQNRNDDTFSNDGECPV